MISFAKRSKTLTLALSIFITNTLNSNPLLAIELSLENVDGDFGVKLLGSNTTTNFGLVRDYQIATTTYGVNDVVTLRSSGSGSYIDFYFPFSKTFDSPTASLYEWGISGRYYYSPNRTIDLFSVGDVNSDGRDDMILLYDNQKKLFYGSTFQNMSTSLASTTSWENRGITFSQLLFENIRNAIPLGDINGDGDKDFLMETRTNANNDTGTITEHTLHVVFGGEYKPVDISSDELDGYSGFTITLPANNKVKTYAGNGDINGDGLADIVISSTYPSQNTSLGIYVIYGRPQFPLNIDLDTFSPSDDEGYILDLVGTGFSTPGDLALLDFNGDGYSDIVSRMGIIYGSAEPFSTGTRFTSLETPDVTQFNFNHAYMRNGGDFDGDGRDEILVSQTRLKDPVPNSLYTHDHLTTIIFGRSDFPSKIDPDTLDSAEKITIVGSGNFDAENPNFARAGDLNGDGLADLKIGNNNDNGGNGSLHIVFGDPNRWSDSYVDTFNSITTYRSGFQGSIQSAGWNYYWNPIAAIGDSSHYQQLKWTSWNYDNDGISGRSDDQLNYGNLNENGGHPGKGAEQGGVSYDRYVIAAYQASQDGVYAIQDSFIDHTTSSCAQWSNGDDIRVYVNDSLQLSVPLPKQGSASFDTALGSLNAGDQIYVAIGPNGRDGCDGFSMDYAIAIEGTLLNTVPVLNHIADQVTNQGISVSMSVNASDTDSLTYSAIGLPTGLNLSSSGIINGTPNTAGSYSVLVTATDPSGAYDHQSFNWTIGNTSTVLAGYQADFASTANWSYLWNADSSIGNESGYVGLAWSGSDFRSGESSYPASSELRYGFLGPRRSHPGAGINIATENRYVIAAYTFDQPGSYRLENAYIEHLVSSCSAYSNGGEVHVYINDSLVDSFTYAPESYNTFNMPLGTASVGDKLYVAVGPNGADGCDSFGMDYSIVLE